MTKNELKHLCNALNNMAYDARCRDDEHVKMVGVTGIKVDPYDMACEASRGLHAEKLKGADKSWPQTMDARVWADEFCKRNSASDHGTMLGWFANAIMAGYDAGMRRVENQPSSYLAQDKAIEVNRKFRMKDQPSSDDIAAKISRAIAAERLKDDR